MSIFLFIMFTWACAAVDAYYINKGTPIDSAGHEIRAILRVIVAVVLAIIEHPESQLKAFILILWFGSFFWLFFDLLLNLYRGLPIFYVGKTSKIDQLFNKYPVWMHILKVTLLATFTIIYKSL